MIRAPLEPALWFRTAAPAPATRQLTETRTADVCCIGAGYTGLSTALHLAREGVDTVVLEAEEIGFGGSGRNAGHCTPTFIFHDFPKIRAILGEPFAARLIERQTNATNLAFELIGRYGIDCEGVQNGYLQVAHSTAALAGLEKKCRQYNGIGKKTRMLDKAETERLSGSPRYFGAWLHPEGGHLNPLGYARGLARAALLEGARIFTRSPVTRIAQEAGRWRVETPSGAVVADKVVCGTGAYTSDFWPGLEKSFKILTVTCLATRPLSANLRRSIAPQNHTVVESRGDPMIYKYDKDGRLVTSVFVEGRRGRDRAFTEALIARKLEWMLPQLGPVEWDSYWHGDLDMQPRTLPRLFDLAPGVVAALGYSGRGVPTGTMMGTVLADWAMGKPRDELALPLEPLVPAPFWLDFAPRLFLGWSRLRDDRAVRRDGLTPPAW